MKINVGQRILDAHDAITAGNRDLLIKHHITTINLMGSPGAGKTSILEGLLPKLSASFRIAVIEGGLFTSKDAERIAAQGVPAVQINTRGACHLDGNMIAGALAELPLEELNLLIIENIGNLVCPAEFDLGEDLRICLLSVTEGEDKISKYPLMFKEADVVVLNKVDLLPYVDFSLDGFYRDLRLLNPETEIIEVSCRSGSGLSVLAEWMRRKVDKLSAGKSG